MVVSPVVGHLHPAPVVAVAVRFDLFGDTQLLRTIDRRLDYVSDMRPAWRELRRLFLVAERRQFATQGAWGSGGWAPLSEDYRRWKLRVFPGKTILRATDELYRSLTEGPQIYVERPHEVIMGSAVRHGRFHQSGGGNLPRRRVLELPESERRGWVKVMQRYLVTGRV